MGHIKVYSPEEARTILRVGRTVFYRWLHEGRIQYYRNGRRYLIPEEAIRAFLDTQVSRQQVKVDE